VTHGCSWIRLVGPVALLTLLTALAVTPAFGALPYGYGAQRVGSTSPVDGAHFGDAVVDVGDLNGDQVDDIAAGSPGADGGKGAVYLVSGKDGSILPPSPIPAPADPFSGGKAAGFGTSIAAFGDFGGCPGFGGGPGDDCDAELSDMNTPDRTPDLLVGAPSADVASNGDDIGRAYLIDGALGSVLKRIDMPAADRADQAGLPPELKPAFGQTILVPAGLPPCTGHGGVGACDTLPTAVRIGDLDGGGRPDIVVAAPRYYENGSTSAGCVQVCPGAGRVYVYKSELFPPTPSEPLSTAFTIKAPQANSGTATSFGSSLTAAGDVGKCGASPPPAPLSFCAGSNVPDSKPDFVISAPHSETSEGDDTGVAYVFDSSTNTFVDTLKSPGPQSAGLFGLSGNGGRALGDFAGDSHYDLYEGAPGELGHGRGYVFNGDISPSAQSLLQRLDDPTPTPGAGFGGSWAAVGDVAGDAHTEVMVGTSGSSGAGDVAIFGADGSVLQSISDPDGQTGSGFGQSIAPLGDVNGDGFLDFAVGAGGYGSGKGRLYIFRSDNTAPPPPPPPPPPPGPVGSRSLIQN
jgi:hypothetical protein